jgi:outer membrane protein OmpA-like peptidoglycan-associated protein
VTQNATPSSTRQRRVRLGSAAALLIALSMPVAASAQEPAELWQQLHLRLEGGMGAMLPDFQRESLGQDYLLQGTVRFGMTFADLFGVQISYGSWLFPGENGDGQVHSLTLGPRLDLRAGDLGRLVVDVNLGLGQTADLSRFTLDAGIGYEFDLHPMLSAGPIVRYGHVFATQGDHPSDAQYLSFGISVVLRPPARTAPEPLPGDRDGDGVPDEDDLCPNQHAGGDPDPDRPGCPRQHADADGDGVLDHLDQCPDTPAGEHPDPDRPGCPLPDRDGDGVPDHLDQCPEQPMGDQPHPDRLGCPDADRDGDGVPDSADRCPDQPRGLNPDPARPGCPLPDRDNDSVPDAVDACPDVAGSPSDDPRRHGCPGLIRVEGEFVHISQAVFFATNRDRILPRSLPVLRALRAALDATPTIRRVSIEGHTDDVGGADFNLDLSRRRAESVMRWLIENGIAPERLEAHGFGQTRPQVEGTSTRARAQNRRVEFRIIDSPMGRTQRRERAR